MDKGKPCIASIAGARCILLFTSMASITSFTFEPDTAPSSVQSSIDAYLAPTNTGRKRRRDDETSTNTTTTTTTTAQVVVQRSLLSSALDPFLKKLKNPYTLGRGALLRRDKETLSYRSLHQALEDTFYPAFSYKDDMKAHKQKSSSSATSFPGMGFGSMVKKQPMPKGLGGGRMVDHLMNAVVNRRDPRQVGKTLKFPPARYLVTDAELEQINCRPSVFLLSKEHAECLPPACRAYLLDMVQKGWFPVAAQVPVACPLLRWYTKGEQLWANPDDGTWAYVELDKSEAHSYHTSTGKLQKPLQDMDSSPANRKQLQLAYSVWMAEQTFGIRFAYACVARVGSTSHQLLPMADWVASYMPVMLRAASSSSSSQH